MCRLNHLICLMRRLHVHMFMPCNVYGIMTFSYGIIWNLYLGISIKTVQNLRKSHGILQNIPGQIFANISNTNPHANGKTQQRRCPKPFHVSQTVQTQIGKRNKYPCLSKVFSQTKTKLCATSDSINLCLVQNLWNPSVDHLNDL